MTEACPPRTIPPTSCKGHSLAWAALAAGLGVIAAVRPGLASELSRVKADSSSYALPPPTQTVVLSLGYRAALADFLYAHVRVSHGAHFMLKRRFEHAGRYLDVINALDPTFPEPYLYADTIITVQPVGAGAEDYEKAREILLRGTAALPYSQEVWFVAGQFIGYIAPPFLESDDQRRAWRVEGGKILGRACELASDNQNIPHHCISAATLLNKEGEQEAMIKMLERTLAVTDDEEIRERALSALSRWGARQQQQAQLRRIEAFREGRQLRFIPVDRTLLMGPPVDLIRCASPRPSDGLSTNAECDYSWRSWFQSRFGGNR